ncbi:MAG TPA: hypothetical protein VGS41_04460, partial [Chthonomonadales bacterium]|nr:hypothetical protein [Chthonomonadales bacterium]
VSGGAAVVRGRGEQIEPLPAGPELWLVIVKPQISVSTAWAYGAIDSMPDRVSHRMTGKMAEALKEGEARRIVSSQCNDFEAALFPEMPALAWLHDELIMAGAAAAHVCGSGAALYGMAESEAAAHKIAAQFQGRYPFVSVARTAPRQARFSSDGEGR